MTKVDRTIVREPAYETKPRYALLVFGEKAQQPIWMIEDDRTLYIDRNGNRDLTDDGPPIQPSDLRTLGRSTAGHAGYDFNYVLQEFGPSDSALHTEFDLRRWNYEGTPKDSYGLSLKVAGDVPMYCGWFNPFWAATPKEAPVFHFAGPLSPRLLRSKEFVVGKPLDRLSIHFINVGLDKADATRLSIDSLPADLNFKVDINWPVAEGGSALKTTHTLNERCCYWEFYTTTFRVPEATVPGQAKVTVHVPPGFPMPLATNQFEVPVVGKALPVK